MSRLSCPSKDLQLRALFRRARYASWIALALAVGLHGLLSQAEGFRTKERLAKPLTTQFIKRQPRLTKPLEMKKEPKPRRRRIKRSMVSVKPRGVPQKGSQFGRLPGLVPILARPDVSLSRVGHSLALGIEPEVAAQQIAGIREDENVVDMCLEMLDVEALDYGRYCAMVIEDPTDRRNIRGFLHLAVVYPSGITEFDREELMNRRAVQGLAGLANAMNECTSIETDVRGPFPLNSPSIFRTPWAHVQYGIRPGCTTDGELEALGRYALSGGFLFVDSWGGVNDHPMYCDHEWAIVRALSLSGFKRGRDWDFGRMNDDHPVFHCFFDFEGPPVGGYGGPRLLDKRIPQQLPYPDTVCIEGRVMMIFSHYWYSAAWCGEWYEYWRRDNTPQLQFGVNLIVFALTQEGGITKRVMDTFRGF